MIGVLLALVLPFGILAALRSLPDRGQDPRLAPVVLAGYAARVVASLFVGGASLFSYGGGSDADWYGVQADAIARLWHFSGLRYVTQDEAPDLGSTSLPQNVFALVDYVNGEATHIGCAALIAALGCLAVIHMYAIAIEMGASEASALYTVAVVLFMPGFVLYTSDTYKEGFVIFFEFTILRSSLRLSARFALADLVLALLSLAALWVTRRYLVYALCIPLSLALLGIRDRSTLRMAATAGAIGAGALALFAYTKGLDTISEHISATFQQGTSEAMLQDNATGGSGVAFDTSSPYSALGPKILYALFAPFPWQRGSLALQMGKLETIVWYYLFYRAVRAIPGLLRTHRSEVLLLASFIVPVFFMYALSFSNIGLVLRERLGAVIAACVIASTRSRREVLAPGAAGNHTPAEV